MGRTLEQMIAAETPEVQAKIEARALELQGLAEFRRIAAHSQEDLAAKLNLKQPAVSRLERQTDMYLSTSTIPSFYITENVSVKVFDC